MNIGLNNIYSLRDYNIDTVTIYRPHMFEAALKEDERRKRETPNLYYMGGSYCNHKKFYDTSEEERSSLVPDGLCFDNKKLAIQMDSKTVFNFKIDGEIFSAHYHRLTEDNVIEWKHDPPVERIKGKTVFRQQGGEDLPSVFYFTEFDDCCFYQEYLIRDYIFSNKGFIDKSLSFIKEKYGIKQIKVICHEHSFLDSFSLIIQFDSFEFSHNLNAEEILNLEVSYDFLVDRLVDSCEFMLNNRSILKL